MPQSREDDSQTAEAACKRKTKDRGRNGTGFVERKIHAWSSTQTDRGVGGPQRPAIDSFNAANDPDDPAVRRSFVQFFGHVQKSNLSQISSSWQSRKSVIRFVASKQAPARIDSADSPSVAGDNVVAIAQRPTAREFVSIGNSGRSE